jgi:transcriptional regulator with XRE-family HTH domain
MPVVVQNLCTELGKRVRIARMRRNMTQQDFASRVGTSRQTVQRLEGGDPTVGLGIWLSAAWILGLHHDLEGVLDPKRDMVGLREEFRRLPRRASGKRRMRDKDEDVDFDPDKL